MTLFVIFFCNICFQTIDLIEELIGDDAFTMLLSKRGGLLFWIVKIADVLCRVDRSSRDCSLFAPRVVSMLLDRWGVIKSCDKAEGTLAFHVAELSRRLSSSTPEAERKEDKNPAAGTQRDPLQLMTARLIGVSFITER